MKQVLDIINKRKSIFLICLIFVLLFCYIFHIESNFIDGDRCIMILQSADILQGNIFLDNWYSTELSLGITELSFFLIAVKLFGITEKSVYFACSLSVFLCYVLSFLLIKDDIKKLTPLNLIILIMLAGFSNWLIKLSYGHCGCFVCSFLLLFLANKYLKKDKNIFLVLFIFLISLCIFGDYLIVPIVLVPIIICSLLKLFYACEIKKNLKLISFIAAGIFIGCIFVRLYLNNSTIIDNFQHKNFILFYQSQIYHYFLLTLREIAIMCGIENSNRNLLDIFAGLSLFRYFVVFISGYLVFINIKKSLTNDKPDFISSAMSYGIVLLFLSMCLTTYQIDIFTGRYLAFVPFFSAVIILRYFSNFENLPKRQFVIILLYLILSSITTVNLSHNDIDNPYFKNLRNSIISYLKDNNLHYGIANDFINSSPITVLTNNKIKVRIVDVDSDGNIVPFEWFAKKNWFNEPVEFVIVDTFQYNKFAIYKYYEDMVKSRQEIYTTTILVLKDEYRYPVSSYKNQENN